MYGVKFTIVIKKIKKDNVSLRRNVLTDVMCFFPFEAQNKWSLKMPVIML